MKGDIKKLTIFLSDQSLGEGGYFNVTVWRDINIDGRGMKHR